MNTQEAKKAITEAVLMGSILLSAGIVLLQYIHAV
jgi:hypothetical protein